MTVLSGKEVVAAIKSKLSEDVAALKEKGINPTLAIVRVGEREDDLSYEKGATTRCKGVGIEIKKFVFPVDVPQEELIKTIKQINEDSSIHGVLIFRPLPKTIDDNAVREALAPEKDVDGITDKSMTGVYSGNGMGYAPCTPSACMAILDHYGIDLTGKNVVVVGRSLVVGKPLAMMLIQKNATVTVCHTRTRDMEKITSAADILVVAAGKAGMIGAKHVSSGQIVIDVGINVTEEGKLTGDVKYDEVSAIVDAITPVPGGVGTVTNSILAKHVVEAAQKL